MSFSPNHTVTPGRLATQNLEAGHSAGGRAEGRVGGPDGAGNRRLTAGCEDPGRSGTIPGRTGQGCRQVLGVVVGVEA